MIINGKEYPLWSQFVDRKSEWIGGLLQDLDEGDLVETEIIDINLRPNGKDSAIFSVRGKEFECCFDCGYGGIISGRPEWITFEGYGGHTWRIKQLNK